MKKILSVILAVIIFTFGLTSCGMTDERKDGETSSELTSSGEDSKSGIKGFTGTITKKWDEVKNDFTSLESTAETEVTAMTTVSRGDVENIVKEMKSDIKELENGVNDENEEKAKEVYKDAHKLELMAKKGNVSAAKEFEQLAKESKALVKHYYGVADRNYTTVRSNVRNGIERIENFTEDVWNDFIDMFK